MTSAPRILPDAAAVAEAAADWITAAIAAAAAKRGGCRLGLCGGTTPRAAYERLAKRHDVPWSRVVFFFGDERCVPPGDADSNYFMARAALLRHVGAAAVHRMHAERPDREQAARDYDALLADPLDVLLLGMGTDGHVASLFPGSPWLTAPREARVAAVKGPKPPPWRLTILPRVVVEARAILVMVTGKEKAAALARALARSGSILETPARLVRRATWLVDAEAARKLEPPRAWP
jgi:6-phosphogluconolactonase